jgi:DNA-binding response OmpR family regulator
LRALVFLVAQQPDLFHFLKERPSAISLNIMAFSDAGEALRALPGQAPAILILDSTLPNLDVLETIQATRRVSDCLLLLISGSADEVDCILALESGADGYLARPFSARQLEANVNALVRRSPELWIPEEAPPTDQRLTFRTLCLNPRRSTLSHLSDEVSLTPKELFIARLMMNSPCHVFAREELLEDFQLRKVSDSRAVDMHIANLRKKIAGLGLNYVVLHSVKGRGYRFAPLA